MSGKLPHLSRNEQHLILNCSRIRLTEQLRVSTESLLHKPLDWNAVVAHAELHGVTPLVYHHLKGSGMSGHVPSEAQREFLRITHRAEYQNRYYAWGLQGLLKAFEEAGIPVLVLKGISLVEIIYGKPALRPLIDLNLLVPRRAYESAYRLLTEMGYLNRIKAPLQGFYTWCYNKSLLVKRDQFELNVLLQYDVVTRPKVHALDLDRFWKDAQAVTLSGHKALIPSPTDFVFYMCLQPHKAFFNSSAILAHMDAMDAGEFIFSPWTENRLIRFTDLYEVAGYYREIIDWELLLDRAKRSGLDEVVFTSLSWVNRLFGQIIEPERLSMLNPPRPRRVGQWMFDALASEFQQGKNSTTSQQLFLAWWLTRQTSTRLLMTRMLELLEYIFPRHIDIARRDEPLIQRSRRTAYLWHVISSLSRCSLGFLVVVYYRLLRRRPIAVGVRPSAAASRK